ncbi:MAG: DUF488 domain-containing protein [Pseudomonadota bacterium]|nr:DUF488 domain-containing protein [Pseudomonadota bacterium]
MISGEIYTLGHRNRALTELIDLSHTTGIQILVDARAHPVSRRHPYFRRERLQQDLKHAGVGYQWMGDQLGGRPVSRPSSAHVALSRGMRSFADHMCTNDFRTAIRALLALADRFRTVLMCAERHPVQCHRSLIADYLTNRGATVIHLIDFDEQYKHRMHPAARSVTDSVVYDCYATGQLDL